MVYFSGHNEFQRGEGHSVVQEDFSGLKHHVPHVLRTLSISIKQSGILTRKRSTSKTKLQKHRSVLQALLASSAYFRTEYNDILEIQFRITKICQQYIQCLLGSLL